MLTICIKSEQRHTIPWVMNLRREWYQKFESSNYKDYITFEDHMKDFHDIKVITQITKGSLIYIFSFDDEDHYVSFVLRHS